MAVYGPMDIGYHPAVVESVDTDEAYIDVIDVSDQDKPRRRYYKGDFLTEEKMINSKRITKRELKEEYKEYFSDIERVLNNNI